MLVKHADVTEQIVAAFYHIYNVLGYGFLEKVYENAMVIELRRRGVSVQPQARIRVLYEGHPVGDYFADLWVAECVIVEIKAVDALAREHHAQLLNYLKATDIEVGLLLNFGPKPEVRRKVFDNCTKKMVSHPPLDL